MKGTAGRPKGAALWRRMDRILQEVLDAPLDLQPALLKKLAGRNARLRATVETRLVQAREEDVLLDRRAPLRGALGEALARELGESRDGEAEGRLADGTCLGPYEIRGWLGAGGTGQVYRARDKRLGREVALKVLSAEAEADRERRDRFQREARTASSLNHPGIVTVFDVGEQEGTGFIAMELVEGRTLRDLLEGGLLPVRQLVTLGAQIAEGMAAAHAAGVVHRDLKPGNVMVDERGHARIVDFGLAKFALQEQQHSAGSLSTMPGTILGTVNYMSPEQAAGRPAITASDQFALGVILYEMATGRRPFDRITRVETLRAILRESPISPEEIRPELAAPLAWAIQRCLAKDPADRYPAIADLARDLTAIAGHLGRPHAVRARPPAAPLATGSRLVGRQRETGEIQHIVREGARLVTLTGAGGSGKTRLAQKAAAELADAMEGGVFFVELAALGDPRLVLPTICEAAGVPTDASRDHLRALTEVWGEPGRPPTLLVLDNFEHLLEAAPRVAALLERCPALIVLVTSREVLHLYGEREYPVLPLPSPPDQILPLGVLGQYPAVELFVERARAVLPAFRLDQDNAAAVAEVCRQLDGLPLALELAAARIKLLSPEAMRGRLANRLELAAGSLRDRPRRQQTLAASMGWSHDLLAPAEQVLFRRLAVFAGGFTLEAAEAVANAREDLGLPTADGVSSLLDKSLLQRVPGGEKQPPRFRMLETVRELALGRLAASGDERVTRKAHAAWCLVLAEEFDARKARERSDDSRLALLDPEIDNVRAAQDWLLQAGEVEWSLRMAAALMNYHTLRDSVGEGRARLAAVLDATSPETDARLRGRVLFGASWFAMEQGDMVEATARARQAFEAAVDWEAKVSALVGQGAVAQRTSDLAAARRFYMDAARLCRASEHPETAAQPLLNLARVALVEGRTGEARTLLAECQDAFRAGGNEAGRALVLSQLADAAHDEGDSAEARALCERSLDIFRRLGHEREVGNRLGELGRLDLEQGDLPGAARRFKEALRIFHTLGAKRHMARALNWLAILSSHQGQPDRCLLMAGAAAAWHRASGIRMPEAERLELDAAIRTSRHALAQKAGPAWMDGWSVSPEQIAEWALQTPEAADGNT